MQTSSPPSRRLVLIGAGHAHVQVLRRLVMEPDPTVHVTVITDQARAIYSGMIPGLVAGQYQSHEVTIDVVPLARRAGAAVVLAAAVKVDDVQRAVVVDGDRPPVRYDVCSIDIGSTVSDADLSGVGQHAVPTRPIGALSDRIALRLAELLTLDRPIRVVVVGAGAAGVELAFAMRARVQSIGKKAEVCVVSASERPRVGGGERGTRRVLAAFKRRGISYRGGVRVAEVREDSVLGEDGTALSSDLTLWAGGAASHRLAQLSGLPVDDSGWLLTTPDLQVVGHPNLFAAGDCAVFADGPKVPRAGVYAVRAGPVLADNVLARLASRPLRAYRPQRHFLALLNTCDGSAIGTRGIWVGEGSSLGRLKDWIDRRFMEKFQVLDANGVPSPAFNAGMPPMADEMVCGGCAAKLADEPLRRALSRLPPPPDDPDVVAGVDVGDDVAVLRHGGGLLVQTVDAFPAFTDDPWLVGRVAAINALNDVWAKGATPRFALAVVEVPEVHGESILGDALAGVRHELDAVGVSLVGGHTTIGTGLRVGLSVTGVPTDGAALWPTRGGQSGDVLVLSRAVGTGVVLHADMAGRATGAEVEALHAHLLRSNAAATRALQGVDIHAATDVTGFGLARHLRTMLPGPQVAGLLQLDAIPMLPGAVRLLAAGERSSFHEQNRLDTAALAVPSGRSLDPRIPVLFDPQTAGGLLLAVPPKQAAVAVDALRSAGFQDAVVVGAFEQRCEGPALRVE